MKLTVYDGHAERIIEHPTSQEVIDGLRAAGWTDEAFMILDDGPDDYVQIASGCLEYRANRRHYRAQLLPAPFAQVEPIFLSYLSGETDWTIQCDWDDVTEKLVQASEAPNYQLIAILAVIALAILVAVWISNSLGRS